MEIFVEFDISIENAFQASYVPLTSFSGKGIKGKKGVNHHLHSVQLISKENFFH